MLEAGEAQSVTISQTYDAGIADVWDACTDPERIPRWFLPVNGELKLGGRHQLEGNAGGTIERCEPPTRFAATWEYGGQMSWIEVRLTAAPEGGTQFELEHPAYPDEHWADYGPGAVGIGWDMAILGLGTHLSWRPRPRGASRRTPARTPPPPDSGPPTGAGRRERVPGGHEHICPHHSNGRCGCRLAASGYHTGKS